MKKGRKTQKILPRISVNIPIYFHGDPHIVLRSLKKVDYPNGLIEVLLIKGEQIALQRNAGLEKSRGDIVYLLDDDSQVQPNALKIIAKEFEKPELAALGGPSLSPKNGGNYLSRLIGYVLETYFGALRMRYKWSRQQKSTSPKDYHFLGANLALRRKVILAVGGFDERIVPNEETELIRRLQENGYEIQYHHKLVIYRNQRTHITDLIKQFHHYGKGRMKFLHKNPRWHDFFLLAPIVFTIYLLTLIFYHPLWLLIPLFLYIFLSIATALKATIKYKKISLLFTMPIVFPIIHISYALGMIEENISSLLKKNPRKNKGIRVEIDKIKSFYSKMHESL